MNPLPDAAWPVVYEIRRRVARPDSLPQWIPVKGNRRRPAGFFRWPGPPGESWCAMEMAGMKQSSHSEYIFADWFDSLTEADAPAAMDLIWPMEASDAQG